MFDCGATGFTESVCFVGLSTFDAFLAVSLFAKKDVIDFFDIPLHSIKHDSRRQKYKD